MAKQSPPKMRRKARALALQAIYQWQMTQGPLAQIQEHLLQSVKTAQVDVPYFQALVDGVGKNFQKLDECMAPILDRPVEELYPIELAILRIAIFELEHHLDVPYRVVINEALELTKIYGATEGFRYVNAVLDQVAKQHREIEIKATPKSKAKE